MSIVKINAITVPAERADVMAQRFAARAGEVGKSDGFEEFQLLRPNDDRTTWLVYTRWRDEAAFEAWRATQFGPGGGPPQGAGQGPPAGGPGGPAGGAPAGGQGAGPAQGGAGGHGSAPGGPVATGSELWSFLVEQRETTG
ncbi:MAG TPA: antibiotic biosynthesis monooxygenase [Acidimicrobiales bacterium]|nr:antibiotic biosynthesis monooxygenase [Acidimicrobiales bacterium]